MLGASNERFVSSVGRAVHFAEFRDFLMLSTVADGKGAMDVWGRAVVDVGDVPMSFPAGGTLLYTSPPQSQLHA